VKAVVFDVLRAARHKVGRRGAALLFFAELDLIYGFFLAFPSPDAARSPTNLYFASLASLDLWAIPWVFVGLMCLFFAFQRYDRMAYASAIAIKVLWGGLAIIGIGFADVPVSAGAIWISLAGLVWVLSGWREVGQDAEDQSDAAAEEAGETDDDSRTP
jgi:hypothetical protein